MYYVQRYKSPLGTLTMVSEENSLIGLFFDGQKFAQNILKGKECVEKDMTIFERTRLWLDLYFKGEDPCFMPKYKLIGTKFQKEVWKILVDIPFGETMTYGQIAKILAKKLGKKSMSAQAVGGAVARNPIVVAIPCHRVIGNGKLLVGYAGGFDKKAWLLKNENILLG